MLFSSGLSAAAHANDPQAAGAAFNAGVTLLQAGRNAEACAKFAESQQLDPSSGTLINLARCHRDEGKKATAYAELRQAISLAQIRNKPDHVEKALQRASALEPELAYLVLRVQKLTPWIELYRDGQHQAPGSWGDRIPVDPGEHEILARAPAHAEFRVKLRIGNEPGLHEVVIPELPALAPQLPIAALPGQTHAPEQRGSSAHAWGYVLGGFGIAALGSGAAFGIMSLDHDKKSERACNGTLGNCNTSSDARQWAEDESRLRDRDAWLANIGIGAGVVGIGASIYLLTRPNQEASTPAAARFSVSPWTTMTSLGASAQGSF